MCDVIEARVFQHATVVALAAEASVPVINGLSDYNHPTQALCDLFTMTEYLPPDFELISSLSGEFKNPRHDIARAIPLSGLILSALYLLGTVGILLVLPVKQIGLTAGLVETFK